MSSDAACKIVGFVLQ